MNERLQIDVEDIMRRIREHVAARRRSEGLPPRSTRTSPFSEGQGAVDFVALHTSYDLQQLRLSSHRWILGPLLVAVKKALRKLLTPVLDQQVAYNAANVRMITHVKASLEALDDQYALISAQLETLERDRADLQDLVSLSGTAQAQVVEAIEELRAVQAKAIEEARAAQAQAIEETRAAQAQAIEELRAETLTFQAQAISRAELQAQILATQSLAVQEVRTELRSGTPVIQSRAVQEARAHLQPELDGLGELARTTKARVWGLERKLRRIQHFLDDGEGQNGHPGGDGGAAVPAARAIDPEFDYAAFAERFRGSEEDIKERQRVYVRYFEGCDGVIDLGCGRGEFLELLREHQIPARGLDLDLDMVLLCREKGLNVTLEDAFVHLRALPDDSVGGIIATQVIEHIAPARVVKLLRLCYRKLAPNGCLIVETPNPKCLMVFADSFYKDLSHVQPVHPDTMQFLFELVGFRGVELQFSAPVGPSMMVPSLHVPGVDVEPFNRGLERLNMLLFGFQDYTAIGRKAATLAQPDASLDDDSA
jgi:O-antigen chain-terminating methyltransferase